jgi:signal transduction histidine kinase
VTAILLFAQFSISRSLALLVLAGGYLFSALIVIPHALTFPGAFSPTGLFGAGVQTSAWLYIFWHLGFPIALIVYAWMKEKEVAAHTSIRTAIGLGAAIAVSLVFALAWVAIVWDDYLPRLFVNASTLTPLGAVAPAFDLAVCAIAFTSLWLRQRSVLGLWLMVVACSLIGELALTVVRFSLGFYVSRVLSLTTSTIVLVILLGQTAGLYTRLARANLMLRRERDNKLMNLEAVVASISHEVKQPLAAIVMRGSTALRFLAHSPPELERAELALNKIVSDGRRASQIFDNLRDLFRASDQERTAIEVNELVAGVLDTVQGELAEHRISLRFESMIGAPTITGHRGQLQEVLLNLIRNAIEAMDAAEGPRILRVTIERREVGEIAIAVIDTGPGIDPLTLDSIFDAFVTTKAHGMGLGLAICRMIVERHGGQLLASSGEGSGAQFEIVLPGRVAAAAHA